MKTPVVFLRLATSISVLVLSLPAFGKGSPPELAPKKPFRVVIDAGHGGVDEGTVYDNGRLRVAEKDVTLLLAKETARQLRRKGIDVLLTREKDQEMPLHARTALANRYQADVFLSIHMNSTSTPMVSEAEGVETYILNNTSDAASRRLAYFENQGVSTTLIDAPAEQPDVALILKDLQLGANLSESKRLACAVQGNLVEATTKKSRELHHRDRGVKQALFYVLLGADMPSILVEAGFLTNPKDRAIVLSTAGQRAMSTAIAQAVEQFRSTRGTVQAHRELSSCKVR